MNKDNKSDLHFQFEKWSSIHIVKKVIPSYKDVSFSVAGVPGKRGKWYVGQKLSKGDTRGKEKRQKKEESGENIGGGLYGDGN